jgi:uncharacterized protein (DUF488 family)
MGIEYRHFPVLGIVSDKRRELENQADYDALFAEYEKTTLPAGGAAIDEIGCLLKENKRIALLCYERLPAQCHRTRVINAVLAQSKLKCQVHTE